MLRTFPPSSTAIVKRQEEQHWRNKRMITCTYRLHKRKLSSQLHIKVENLRFTGATFQHNLPCLTSRHGNRLMVLEEQEGTCSMNTMTRWGPPPSIKFSFVPHSMDWCINNLISWIYLSKWARKRILLTRKSIQKWTLIYLILSWMIMVLITLIPSI